jgi:acyl carrier protein
MDELYAHARQSLPDYMIPSAFVRMEALPLSPSGKVDLRALPAPADEREASTSEDAEPQTPLEQAIAAIWKELLDVEVIRRNDNFFLIGGDSLLGTLVVSRLRQEFEIEVPLTTLFEAPTLAELVEAIMAMAVEAGAANDEAANDENAELDGLTEYAAKLE